MAGKMRILVTKQNAGVSEWASATRLLRRSAPRNDIRGHGMSLRAKRSNLTPIVGARADRTRHNCAKQSQFAGGQVNSNCFSEKGLRRNLWISVARETKPICRGGGWWAQPTLHEGLRRHCAKQSQFAGSGPESGSTFWGRRMGDLRGEACGGTPAKAGRVDHWQGDGGRCRAKRRRLWPAGAKWGCMRTRSDEIGRKSVDRGDAGVRMCGF